MIKLTYILLLTLSLFLINTPANAEKTSVKQKQITNVSLQYISGKDVISVLQSLIDKSVLISEKDNVLFINGTPDKTKNILQIIEQVDTPPAALTIEFIASSRKIDFKKSGAIYQTKNNTTQSMSITERQWVTLNTGLSLPIAERKRYADGTETQSFRYKKITKSYVFKVHEFSGWSIIQVGLNTSPENTDIADAIEETELDTTIVGKTEEWLEITSSKRLTEDVVSTNNNIFLYLKVKESKIKNENEIKTETTK
ncbi:MAG: secretin N-terminal domain-containing protein [Thiohalomonadales bacterium]